jgi:hypothetical protein
MGNDRNSMVFWWEIMGMSWEIRLTITSSDTSKNHQNHQFLRGNRLHGGRAYVTYGPMLVGWKNNYKPRKIFAADIVWTDSCSSLVRQFRNRPSRLRVSQFIYPSFLGHLNFYLYRNETGWWSKQCSETSNAPCPIAVTTFFGWGSNGPTNKNWAGWWHQMFFILAHSILLMGINKKK